ncbi:PilC/PilY family type IV pilus protein [Rhodoferax sp. OV413]|uniref:pilus assembly protein n=1 Tax=Rhodoferax sp. OV413 TaxID=1855285 RepID=UPI0025D0C951|nr:PilC/PilY family type IV pilus protein [Rhodoferax sp. OV413]
MNMMMRTMRTLCILLGATMAFNTFAAVSQTPLLSKTVNVRPNITILLDTSGSMDWDCVYAKHVNDAILKDNYSAGSIPGLTTDCFSASDPRQSSPVNNSLFYNPKKTYPSGYVAGARQSNAALLTNTLTVYLPKTGIDVTAFTSSSAISNVNNYDKYEIRSTVFAKNGSTSSSVNPFGAHSGTRASDCKADPCTLTEERQNYANWKKYHSDRMLAAKTGLTGAFVNQPDTFRLSYADIYSTPNTIRDFELSKSSFYTWLDARVSSGGTPLRTALDRAGKYYSNTGNSGPWGTKPWDTTYSETPAKHLSCRRSYTLLITDGFYNDSSPPSYGNVDATVAPKPAHGYAFDASKTFQYKPGDTADKRNRGKSDLPSGSGGYSNTLADVALKYWITDLRTDLVNSVGGGTPADPPFWQNMTTYTVSFGAPGLMSEADIAKAKNGTLAWVQPKSDTYSAIDDMRHAAHNGGGDFLTVSDAQQFTQDLGNVIGSIASQQFSQAGVAASAVTLTAGTKKFIPYYTSGSWWGNVQMVDLNSAGENGGVAWQVITTDANGQPTGATTLPAPAARNIVVWVDKSKQAVDFSWTQVSNTANNLRGTDAKTQMSNAVTVDQINYLRGDQSKEGSPFRKRNAVLGDIVNSTPAFIKNNTNPKYENLPSSVPGVGSYDAYMKAKAARTEGILLLGANDGMVHAFAEGEGLNKGGREVFAYVPRSVLGKLESLTESGYSYNHTFTVDGPLTETDAYVATPDLSSGVMSTGWSNIVVGTTGAGAQSVFALNVTKPLGMNGRAVLWEINSSPTFPTVASNSSTSFQELGHVLFAPQSGITVSGDWVTIFGNGYDSKSGKASLFIVNTGTGQLIKRLDTDSSTGNGLGGVRLVLNAKQQIIGAYAGDLLGRLWKFDLSGAGSADWKVANGGTPLFTAKSGGTNLPITAPPAVLERTDLANFRPSYMLTVGTGKLFEPTDPTATGSTQAVFGLWDKQEFGVNTSDVISDADLVAVRFKTATSNIDPLTGQTLNSGGVITVFGVEFSSPSVTAIDYSKQRGWRLDLTQSPGQRIVYPVQIVGDVAKIDSVSPQPNTSDCQNSNSNAASIYLNPITGACRIGGTIDTNNDGYIDEKDENACGYSSIADGMDVVLQIVDAQGRDTGLRDIQSSGGHIKVRSKGGQPPEDCTSASYAAAHADECKKPDCTSETYRKANPGVCVGSTVTRSWRQIYPRLK